MYNNEINELKFLAETQYMEVKYLCRFVLFGIMIVFTIIKCGKKSKGGKQTIPEVQEMLAQHQE